MTKEEFAAARKAMRLSQEKLAAYMNFATRTVWCLENGKIVITQKHVLELDNAIKKLRTEKKMIDLPLDVQAAILTATSAGG